MIHRGIFIKVLKAVGELSLVNLQGIVRRGDNIFEIKRVRMSVVVVTLISITLFFSSIFLPAYTYAAIPSTELPNIFPSSIYRNAEHVHSVDEGSVSNHYYSTNVQGWDSLYWAYQPNAGSSFLNTGSALKDPNFESAVPSSAWASQVSCNSPCSFLPGFPVVESSSAQSLEGGSSLHLRSSSTSTHFAYAGASQSLTHSAPLSSKTEVTYSVFPVSLTSTTTGPDSHYQIRMRLLYWEDKTLYPNIIFVFKDNPGKSVGFTNNTNNVFLLRQANFNQWTTFTENITKIAEQTFGQNPEYGTDFTADQGVKYVQFRAYTRNGAEAEAYFDAAGKTTDSTPSAVYGVQSNQLQTWSTPSFQLVPGLEPTGASNLFGLDILPNKFFLSASGSSGPLNDINTLHSEGLYAGLAHPFQTSSQLQNALNRNYPVDMTDIYGNTNSDLGTQFVTDTQVWDDYLNKEIITMATATPNVHAPPGVDRMNTDSYAMYAFADPSASVADQLESIAMGRSFIETVAVGGGSTSNNPLILYFASQNDNVPMGRYPVITDPRSTQVNLHVILQNIPASPNLNLVMKRDGAAIGSPIPLPAGSAGFDTTLSLPLPDGYTYFRYEIQAASTGRPLAFSQPLIFVSTPSEIFPGFWTALVPENSAALDLPASSVSFDNNILTEQVGVRLPQGDGEMATVKIFIPAGMFNNDQFTSSPPGTFDPATRILTINSIVTSASPVTITVQPS